MFCEAVRVAKVPFAISSCSVGLEVDMDVSRSVELRDGNDRMHCSFEVCDPIVESVVGPLSPGACEVCDEEAVAGRSFNKASNSLELGPW